MKANSPAGCSRLPNDGKKVNDMIQSKLDRQRQHASVRNQGSFKYWLLSPGLGALGFGLITLVLFTFLTNVLPLATSCGAETYVWSFVCGASIGFVFANVATNPLLFLLRILCDVSGSLR